MSRGGGGNPCATGNPGGLCAGARATPARVIYVAFPKCHSSEFSVGVRNKTRLSLSHSYLALTAATQKSPNDRPDHSTVQGLYSRHSGKMTVGQSAITVVRDRGLKSDFFTRPVETYEIGRSRLETSRLDHVLTGFRRSWNKPIFLVHSNRRRINCC